MSTCGLRQRGFSLLEVLVAFALLGLSLGIVLQVFATGLRNTALAEEYTLATLHAESVLALLGTEIALAEGVEEGQIDDKFSWRSTVSAYVDDNLEMDSLSTEPYQVTVEVFWQGPHQRRSVVLQTLRLAAII